MSLRDKINDTMSKLPTISNKDLYSLYPDDDQGSIRNYRANYLREFTTPNKKSNSYTSKRVKSNLHDKNKVDLELLELSDSDLIKHTCRNIIANKGNDSRIKLQASTLLLNFIDKTGEIEKVDREGEYDDPMIKLLYSLEDQEKYGYIDGKKPDTNIIETTPNYD